MKKLFTITFMVALLISFSVNAQNMVANGDLETWTDGVPDSWSSVESITQESAIVYAGTYSARHQSAASTQDFGHETITGIVAGGTYVISYYYMDNDPNAKTRIWSKWQDASGAQMGETIESDFSVDNAEWQSYNETFIAPVGATQFYLEIRVYKEAAEGGYVYYDDFSMVNDQNVYPEPTNYPTSFEALANGLSVELSWVDAVGDQLPTGYIIVGEKNSKNIEVPVDGVPVENDLDWSDGSAAMNVAFGQQSYVFANLATSSSYTFAIYPYTNTGSDIDYKTDGTAPSANGETSNVSQLLGESFDTDLGNWTEYSVTGEQVWEWASFGNPPGSAKMSGYAGGAVENQDWLISPVMNMTNYSNISFTFEQARNYATNDGLYVKISSNYDGESDPNDAEWTDLTSSFIFPEGGWDFISAGNVDITSYAGEATYVAFVYNSGSDEAATWEIDNVEVLGIIGTGIENTKATELSVYPNPATSMIAVNSDDNAVLSVFSLTGKKVIETSVVTGENQVNISELHSGMYFVVTISENGNKAVAKLQVK